MKNRYTGDIGDYSKLGLLRALRSAGFSIGCALLADGRACAIDDPLALADDVLARAARRRAGGAAGVPTAGGERQGQSAAMAITVNAFESLILFPPPYEACLFMIREEGGYNEQRVLGKSGRRCS